MIKTRKTNTYRLWRVFAGVLFGASAIAIAACAKKTFKASKTTEEYFHVQNNDYLIPVLVRGNTASNKIIVYVQGGPGYPSLDFAKIDFPGWKNTLEREYAIAYYDQRGTGNRQGDFSQGSSVLQTWVSDLHQVVRFVKKAYNAEVILLGHSFGGSLVYRYMIEKGQEGAVKKYISSNAPVTTDSDADTLRWKFRREFLYNTAQNELAKGRRTEKWNEVLEWLKQTPVIKKLEGSDPYRLMKKWNSYVEELVYVDYPEKSIEFKEYLRVVFASAYNPTSYLQSKYGDELTTRILREEAKDPLMTKLPVVPNQPLLVLTGRFDDICPPEELEYVFARLGTKEKSSKIIEAAGHTPFVDQSVAFYTEIKQFIEK